jgi:transposase
VVVSNAAQQIAQLEAQLAAKDAENAELREKLEYALARIAELEAKLNQNSSNSSRPPSSDPPWANKRRAKPRSKGKRKRGAQKGHRGHRRALVPPEALRHTYDLHPEHCGSCGSTNLIDDGSEPLRHQVTDLPPIEPFTDEWRQHLGLCLDCGAATRAALPADVPRSNFGPAITALVALLTAVYKVSKRGVQELFADVFRVWMSLGAVSNCERQVAEAAATPVEEAREYVQDQSIAHADETSWKERAKKMWLWVMATTFVSVFYILPGRTSACAQKVLGRFKGILVSDRFKAYLFYSVGHRQICWSHLLRDFVALSEHDGVDGDFGHELVTLTLQMFALWHQARDGPMSRSTFRRKMAPLSAQIEEVLEWGADAGVQWRKFDDILKHREALWTFVKVDGVEPTNNHAEQQVRHGVLLRKVSLGTQSVRGSVFIERMLTVVATLRKQRRNVHEFLTEACRARITGSPSPSLLPDHAIDEVA